MEYYCIEFPCILQNPKPLLEYKVNINSWICPYCFQHYSQELAERLSQTVWNGDSPTTTFHAIKNPMIPDKHEYRLVMDNVDKDILRWALFDMEHRTEPKNKDVSDRIDALMRQLA